MIDENKWNQYGFQRSEEDIKGITLHETGEVDKSAEQIFNWLNNENKTSSGCHYIVDDVQTIQVMPDDWAVYHTGKGKDFGCRYTIAIEICSSLSDEKIRQAEDRLISLVYSLQKKYHIPIDMIFFHRDFNDRNYCPKTLIDEYKTSLNFAYQNLGFKE